jgi:hypothetical protein
LEERKKKTERDNKNEECLEKEKREKEVGKKGERKK